MKSASLAYLAVAPRPCLPVLQTLLVGSETGWLLPFSCSSSYPSLHRGRVTGRFTQNAKRGAASPCCMWLTHFPVQSDTSAKCREREGGSTKSTRAVWTAGKDAGFRVAHLRQRFRCISLDTTCSDTLWKALCVAQCLLICPHTLLVETYSGVTQSKPLRKNIESNICDVSFASIDVRPIARRLF